ncbi:MAG TPA: type III pantothenate kinase [Vicinamibacterales bacterium]|nr:type III pantothenate kinase [Acidobacteriota bacterium]HOC18121.1 type III pantothenate kinase [Vicinamibacterales bacterium]
MLLALDIGNTNIVVGVFDGNDLLHSWRLSTLRQRTADEMGIWLVQLFRHGGLEVGGVDGVVMASVVPTLTRPTLEMAKRYFGHAPLVVDGEAKTGMPVLYEAPAEVGADRIVNGVAAFERHGTADGRPRALVVVDFGTATTFDAITSRGEYLGGVICPGVTISADALFERAARLPRVDVRKPAAVIGRTTVGSMQSGLFYGYVGLVEGIVERMKRELGAPAGCVATGGLAEMIAPETPAIEAVDRDLTLHGLRIIWDRNRG